MKYEIEYIEKIAKIVTDNNLSEIYLEDGDQAISVRKEGTFVQAPAVPPSVPVSNQQISSQPKEETTSWFVS